MTEPDSEATPETAVEQPTRNKFVATLARWGMVIILVGAALNLALAWQSIGSGANRALDNVAPGWLVVAATLGIAPWFFVAGRIWMWAGFLGSPISFRDALRTTAATELTSSISPKAIGGAPAKIALLIDSGVRPGRAASILMLDNIADVVFFAAVAPGIAFFTARWRIPEVRLVLLRTLDKLSAAAPWVVGAAVLLALIVVVWRRRTTTGAGGGGSLRRTLAQVRTDFFSAYTLVAQRGKLHVLAAIALTTGLWFCRASVATAVIFGLGQQADPVLFFLLQWVVFAMMVFVPTPGAALGAEASFAAILDGFVVEGLLGVLTAGWRFFSFYLPLLFGLVLMPLLSHERTRG